MKELFLKQIYNKEFVVKKCTFCEKFKHLNEFWDSNKNAKFGKRTSCKECSRKRYQDYYKNQPYESKVSRNNRRKFWIKNNPGIISKINRRSTLKKYGITPKKYDEKLKKQNYRCAICGIKEEEYKKNKNLNFSVDHNHKTGIVRGLLCNNCNRSIGLLKEDILTIKNMIKYIQNWNKGKVEEYEERKNFKYPEDLST